MLSSFAPTVLLSLALAFVANADSHVVRGRHHRDLSHRSRGDVQVQKRYTGAKWSYYKTGQCVCFLKDQLSVTDNILGVLVDK
jgi:hypothetical protein